MGAPTRIAVLTISDAGARGEREDRSGHAIVDWIAEQHHELTARALVPDESLEISNHLMQWADSDIADLIITTGGTGLAPRDHTPEATRAVIDREAPGIAEAIRATGLRETPRAALSRGIAGIRGRTLIVNLPGSTSAVRDGLTTLAPLVDHLAAILHGDTAHQ
ncbi:MAG TPA: MogA/MoaB family molybdenum cofactor biosynthesis protein [Gemmatimonadales bacterium]|jgi:molybdenum cofactor synthesis domain-containing protein